MKGKPLNNQEDIDRFDLVMEAINLLGKLDRLFIKERIVPEAPDQGEIVKLKMPLRLARLVPKVNVYYERHEYPEMLSRLYNDRTEKYRSLTEELFPEVLKGEISDILEELNKFYGVNGSVDRSDERIMRAKLFLNWLDSKRSKTRSFQGIKELKDLFKDNENYSKIMKILVSRKLIDPDTHVCIDRSRGYQTFFVSIVKTLHAKGYFIEKPSPQQTILILKNTFEVAAGDSCVKHNKLDVEAKARYGNDHPMMFIPPA